MINSHLIMSIAMAAINQHEKERQYLQTLTPEQRQVYLDVKEKQRQEAIAERRHQELCAAIRSTSFW